MRTIERVIEDLESGIGLDRRLDSEVTALAVGPPGCVLDSVDGLDGWDIQYAPDADGQAACWREAADVPGVTVFLDAAVELVTEARPDDAGAILARALKSLIMPTTRMGGDEVASRAARTIAAELLRSLEAECRLRLAYAA